MAKIEIELVAEVLANESKVEKAELDRIVRLLTRAAERAADEAAAAKEPTTKKQMVVVISDPRNEIPTDTDFVAWVMQIPENDAPATTLDRVVKAAHSYNLTRRGQKYPVKSIAEACEVVGAKFLKEMNVAVKTRLPVSVLVTDNELPKDRESAITLEELRQR